MARWPYVALLALAVAGLAGCRRQLPADPVSPSAAAARPVSFEDVSERAGIRFRHHSGMFGRKFMPETVGSGCAFLDYDKDGLLDLFVTNYVKWTPKTDPWCGSNSLKQYCSPANFEGVPSLLYHNEGKGRFRDVSDETGIASHVGKSFGVAVADY